jgi:tRNA A37 threonylcarbamoyladenosine dehydratase
LKSRQNWELSVGIIGLGGLGGRVCEMLARVGIEN